MKERSGKLGRFKAKDPGEEMDQLNAYIHTYLKRLIPPGIAISKEIEDMILVRWGSSLKRIEEIDLAIERKDNDIKKLNAEILELEQKRKEIYQEEERVRRVTEEAAIKNKFAQWVVFRQMLVGSVLGKSDAIKAAFGVEIQDKMGHWSILLRKQHFPYESNYDNPQLGGTDRLEPFVQDLIGRFYEIAPGIHYVGHGNMEDREFQSYQDIISGSLRMCGAGHIYDALANECPHCKDLRRGIYVVMKEGLPAGVVSPYLVSRRLDELKQQKEAEELPARMAQLRLEDEEGKRKRITAGDRK